MKRLISANPSEILQMNAEELKQSILASEGRVVLSENVVTRETFVGDITNSEIARAFGADMILLNCVDVFEPKIYALDSSGDDVIHRLHQLVACPIGVNLEPIDPSAKMLEETQEIVAGRVASVETLNRIEELGFDFVCLTGNPGTGVNEPVAELSVAEQLLEAGADVILVPAVGTVPAFHDQELREVVDLVHSKGGLVLSAIGTSQETSDTDTIKEIALRNKICGVDIQHIGDAGYGGLATVDNIYALSKAIRGVRHTVSRLARSVNR